jgi:heptosyltransferase-2|tara:strand:- start:4308 stop:5297 length:990 start_codon:yes stop_codon:yes gene_type:complete
MRIGVFCPSWVGDAVMSIPFFNQLREHHKNAVIFAISKSWVSPIFTNHPDISEIISFEKKDISGIRSTKNSGLSLKALDFDIFYLLSDSYRSAYIARKSETPIIIGYSGQGRTQMLTRVISRSKNKTHRINYYLNLLIDQDFVMKSQNHSGIKITQNEKQWAQIELSKLNIENPIAFFPFSVAKSRNIPELQILLFLKNTKKNIIIFGGKEDRKSSEKIISELQAPNIFSLVGKYDLRKSIALISQCNGAIASDSGLGHISANIGVPTVSMFGAGDSDITGPIGPKTTYLNENVYCSPCLKNNCDNKKEPLLCLNRIKPEKAWDALFAL